ncbi:hypothetical protein [Methylobacterium haplocladii]|uniref:Uncharacterized protein n=1 Tax=Methylobacterium haplocladii TaxID=1176176 RepID=A0A512IL50_9HYPH|nr:hypothetical protein [Methylobacterium haplocladii]GEO98431.1 hypothetical protein MHA02_08190 [Methylobacterium haplocladii]GJD83059.1 hypothetical protein HPGCJGGD_0921 [Methylobacterium haplocladii]GLS61242.1 hypothetical protein GCM10007887_39400 [Methylobacterium haplocladii]
MRARILVLSSALVLAGLSPAFAQLSGGVGSSNAANQSFQQQNSFRGLQQQQTFNRNEANAQNRSNQLYNNSNAGSQAYVPRRRHR